MGNGTRLRVDVLGPIRVVDGSGADVTPEGPLQRRLLALLVLRRGHVVSADVAIDVLPRNIVRWLSLASAVSIDR